MQTEDSNPPDHTQPSAPPEEELPMLDVHPPHQSIHGWRDFLIHIATITIGLLIALGLEAAVEALHHHHIVREAREQIRGELQDNQKLLATDRQQLEINRQRLRHDTEVLVGLKDHSSSVDPATFDLLHWYWSSPESAAYQTARDTGAIALMPYDDAHACSLIYGQQILVDQQASIYIRDFHAAAIPLGTNPDVASLSPAQLDQMIQAIAVTLADIDYLEQLMNSQDANYDGMLKTPFGS
jgi:hypothetical protein